MRFGRVLVNRVPSCSLRVNNENFGQHLDRIPATCDPPIYSRDLTYHSYIYIIAILLSSHTSSTYLISCTINLFHHKVSTPTHYSTSLVLIPRNNLSIFSLKYTTLDNILCCMPNIVYQMFTLSSSHSQFLLKNRFQPKCSYRGFVRV